MNRSYSCSAKVPWVVGARSDSALARAVVVAESTPTAPDVCLGAVPERRRRTSATYAAARLLPASKGFTSSVTIGDGKACAPLRALTSLRCPYR